MKGKERKERDGKAMQFPGKSPPSPSPRYNTHTQLYSRPPKSNTPYNIQMAIRTMGNLIIWWLYGVFNFGGRL